MSKTIQLKVNNEFVYPISEIYSTDERIIGTWKNGKPIYRRITEAYLDGTYKENSYTFSWIGISENAETQVDLRCHIEVGDGRTLTESSILIDIIKSSANTLQIGYSDVINLYKCPITIISEYTKYTD